MRERDFSISRLVMCCPTFKPRNYPLQQKLAKGDIIQTTVFSNPLEFVGVRKEGHAELSPYFATNFLPFWI